MLEVIGNKTHVARKEYYDDGWEFMGEWISSGCYIGTPYWYKGPRKHITFAEGRILVKYRKDRKAGNRIYPGQLYQRQFNKYDGQVYYWRMKKDLYDIACKYELFPEY